MILPDGVLQASERVNNVDNEFCNLNSANTADELEAFRVIYSFVAKDMDLSLVGLGRRKKKQNVDKQIVAIKTKITVILNPRSSVKN